MKTLLPHCFLILALLAVSAGAQQPNEKAGRYLEPLLKRPGSGPLFERFVDAWLDSDTLDNLQKYLAAKVQEEDTTANRLLFAVFLSRQGETVKALEQFRAALAKDPGSADIWYQKAVVEARTLDFDSAIASLRKAQAAKPAAAQALQTGQLLGRLLARSGRTDEALKVWQDLMTTRPDDEELREDVLELQIAEGLHAAAQATAEALVTGAKDPYKKILHRLRLGDVHDRAGARDKALETYAACLSDAGADSWLEKEISAQLEKLFRREDDLGGLKAFYAKLLEKEPQRLGLRRAQAKLLVEMGETDAAVAAGRELLKLAPGDRAVREEFIALLAGAQKLPEAIAQLEELRKQAPKDAELLLRLATLQNEAGKKKEAADLVREFVKLSGDEASRLRASGLLERCGMPDEAAAVLRESDAPALRQSLASVLHKSGKKDEALTEWKRLAGTSPAAALEAARAMSAHNEIEEAWLLLKENAPRAENDNAFLTALCQTAERTDHAEEALPFVRKLVSRATLATDVESALDLAVKLARKADKVDELTGELKDAASAQDFALLAALREEARDSAGAEAALKKAEAASPEIAASLLVRLYSQRADYMQAALALERLFTSAGGRKAHHAQSLTDLWMRAGNSEKALKAAREWRQLAPGSTTPVLAEARLLQASGKDAESLEVLRRAAGQFEGNEDIRAQLADAYRDSGRMADALRIYSSLYENAADLGAKMRWLQNWAQTAELAGRTQELVEQFEERRRASRDSVVPLLALAEIHRAANNYDSRRKALTEAARLKQNDPELALEIARLESREDNNDGAIRTLRAALPNDKTGAVRQELVVLLLRNGERDEGLRLLSEGQAEALKDPAVVEGVTEGLMARDSAETALAFLTPHLAVHPDDYRLHLLAAQMETESKPEAAKARLLRVLAQRTELPDARRKAFVVPVTPRDFDEDEFIAMLSAVLPPQAVEFMSFAAKSRDQLRGQRRNRSNQSIPLPESLNDAHAAAAAQLLAEDRFAAGGDPDGLLNEMERAGFGTARVIRETGPEAMTGILQSDSAGMREASAASPDNETLLALAALAQMMDWDEEVDADLAGRVWKRFAKERQALALLGALPAVGGDPPQPWENEALTAAESVAKPDQVLLIAAIRAMGTPWGDDEQKRELRPEVQKRLNTLLQRWYVSTDFRSQPMVQMGAMIFLTLANGFQTANDVEGFARLLDEEAARGAGQQQQSSPFAMMYSSRQRGVAQPLGFPPRAAPLGISGIVSSVLAVSGEDDTSFLSLRDMAPDSLRKTADLVKHPVVKLLLLVRAEDEEAAGKLIEERLAAPEPDTVSYLLAASWAEKQGEFVKAAELAKKALFLPLSKETRKALDAAFLSWAESDRNSEPVLAAAREAALRMRRDVLTPEARQQLIAAMDGLGLTSEAEKLARQDANAGQGVTPGAISGGSMRSSVSQTVLTPSGKLLAAGKKDEALPLLVKEIQAFAREALKPAGWHNVRGFEEWYSTLQQHAMTMTVMTTAITATNDAKALAIQGAILDLTGEPKRATETFKNALAAGSTDPGVKFRLFRLIAPAEPKEAAKLLQELPADQRGPAFASLTSGRSSSYSSIVLGGIAGSFSGGPFYGDEEYGTRFALTTVLDAAEVLEACLATMPAADLTTATWLSEALTSLSQMAFVDKGWVAPSLYSAKWASPITHREYAASIGNSWPSYSQNEKIPPLTDEAGTAKKVKERAEIFDRLVEKLLGTPGTASVAWQALKQRQLFDDKQPMPAKLFDAGISAALLDLSVPQKPGLRSAPEDQGWHAVFTLLMPAALRTNRLADLETKLLPEVRRASRGKGLETLERDWTLHRCPDEEFTAKAKETVTKSRGASWPTVFQTALIRRTGTELADELILWMAPRLKSGQDVRDAANALTQAARLLLELKGRDVADKWLRSAWVQVTGTREERAKLMETMDEDGDVAGRKGQPLQWMVWMMTQVHQAPELVFLAMRVQAEEYDAFIPEKVRKGREGHQSGTPNWVNPAVTHLNEMLKAGKAKEAAAWLQDSPFMGSLADFRTGSGLYVQVVDALSRAQMPVLLQMGFMIAAEKQTFGQALMSAAVEQTRSSSVCNAMARWQKDIAALPKDRRDELLAVLRQWSDLENAAPGGLTKQGREFRDWLESAGEDEELAGVDGEVEAFLDPKNLRELRTSGTWEFSSKLRELLLDLIKAESPRAREVVEKVREPAQIASRGQEKHILADALERVFYEFRIEPKSIAQAVGLVLHAVTAPGAAPMPLTWDLAGQLAYGGSSMGRMQRDPVARMKLIADVLAPHVPEGQAELLLPLYWEALEVREDGASPSVPDNCAKVLQWAAGTGQTNRRPDIVRAIGNTAALMQRSTEKIADRKFRGVSTAEQLPAALQPWLTAIRDEKRDLAQRLMVACFVLRQDAWQVEDVMLQDTVSLLEQAAKERVTVPVWQETLIMEGINLREESLPGELPARVLAAVKSGRGMPAERDDIGRRNVKACLRLALRSGNTEAANRILRTCADLCDAQFIAIVARFGTPEQMRNLVRPGRPVLFTERPTRGATNERWRAALPQKLDTALAQVEHEDLRYLARLAVNALGPQSEEEAPSPAGPRLTALAADFSKVPFREVALRERALEILANEPESAAVVAGDIRASLEGLNISTITSLRDDDAKRRKLKMYFAALGGEAVAGNFTMLETAVKEVLTRVRQERDEPGELVDQCLAATGSALFRDWSKKPEALAKACEVYRKVCADPGYREKADAWAQTAQYTALLHALANRMNDLDAWWKALPEDVRAEMEKELEQTDLTDAISGGNSYHDSNGEYVRLPFYEMPQFPGDKAAASKIRDEVFLRFVSSPLSGGGMGDVDDFMSAGWGDAEDALRLEEQWCAASPKGGRTAICFASWHDDNKRYDRELAAAERGLKTTRASRNGNGFHLVWWKVHALYELNRSSEGTELVLKIAKMPAEQLQDEDEQKEADSDWESCISDAMTGPAKQTGSLADTLRVAAAVYENFKDKTGLWDDLETAGVEAAEFLTNAKRIPEAQAAAAFAVKARARLLQLGGESDEEWALRAQAALAGATPAPPLLTKEAVWRWQESNAAPDEAWRTGGFDDSKWKSGAGPFGFGDEGLETEISNKAPDGGVLVSWPFRAEFEVSDPAAVRLLMLNLNVDDGAVVWLNGKEAGRRNMPGGAVTPKTLAAKPINQADEGELELLMLDPKLLVKGKNCIAVEVHQQRPDSSDAAFHAELKQSIGPDTPPADPDKAIQPLVPQLRVLPAEMRKVFVP